MIRVVSSVVSKMYLMYEKVSSLLKLFILQVILFRAPTYHRLSGQIQFIKNFTESLAWDFLVL